MTDAVQPRGSGGGGGRLAGRVVVLLVNGLLIAACGSGSGELPSVDPSRSGPPSLTASVPSPTRSVTTTRTPRPSAPATPTAGTPTAERTPTPEPTQSQAPPPIEAETPTSEPTRTPRPTVTATVTASAETQRAENEPAKATPKESPSADASDVDGAAVSGEEAVSPWAWVILALLVLGVALGASLMMRSRRRRAWQSELAAAERDVAWLARDLVTTLRRTGSAEGAVGGWAVASARVVALEDRLTSLEGQAPDNAARERARSLRDAVRAAKARLDGLADAPAGTDSRPVLDEAVDLLEAALQPAEAVEPAGG